MGAGFISWIWEEHEERRTSSYFLIKKIILSFFFNLFSFFWFKLSNMAFIKKLKC